MTTETTPGTTADGTPVTTGAGTTADGSLSEQERQELESLRAGKQQWLGEKTTYENTKAERDALARQIEAMSSQPPTQGVDAVTANVQARYQQLLIEAAQGDVDAQFRVAQIHGQQVALQKIEREAALSALGGLRQKVEAVLNSNTNLTVAQAKTIVEGDEARARAKEYEDRAAEAKRQAEEAARGSTAGVTSVRSAPVTETNRATMKSSEFNSRMAALNERINNGDKAARTEALKLGRQVDSGEITLILNQ